MNCKENGPLLTLLAIQILLCCALSISQPVVAQEITPDVFKQLRYRHIGPPGNRVAAVAGVPGDPFVYYAGAATGGVFKTIDGGINWTPIFDDQKTLTMGALAVAPSDANIVWAGTGETWIRNNARWQPIGDGIYKSSDGGKTWIHAGLEKTGRIGRIIVHPQDPNIVFAAAMGHCYGPQAERGVFRSQDGGKTWNRVLFVDENTGCADIAMDPKKPRVLYAGMWQTFGETSGGPGSGLYRSQDGGETWKKLSGNGLPEPPLGKIGVAVAASNPSRVYALIETGMGLPRLGKAETSRGVLWKSDDGGENWTLMSCDLALAGRKPYYTRCAVAPDNQDEIYFLDVALTVSTDSGKTTKRIGTELHGDHHDIWIDPTNGSRIIESNDQGVGISSNRGRTWQAVNLPTAQMHRVTVDNQIPYYVYGSLQDMPSHRGPSNSRTGRTGISRGMWHAVGGSEAGFMVPDPADNSI
ncbi:MAG: sialidase, partial [Candidatus Aminicenantes bacterium]|nr:sialidase [Candidatus Aminicenantes bacterium]